MRFAVHTGLFRAASSDEDAREAAVECVRAYRENLRDYSKKSPLEVWYDRLAYADQTKRDHAALVKAVKAGRVEALVEEDL